MFSSYQFLMANRMESGVVMLAMNRPEVANALNTEMANELHDAFSLIARDLKTCRVVLLTGQGKHFCAGADLKERRRMSEESWYHQHEAFEKTLTAILNCPIPVIAAVNGAAFGGGLEMALACDFIYASTSARFALTEATLGIMPGLGGTQQLPRAIGMARAKELTFSGKPFSAEEAQQWGMVNRLLPQEALLNETLDCAKAIAANAPLSVRAIKASIAEGISLPISKALTHELRYYNELIYTRDRHEGIDAFNEKRKPVFTGE